MRTASGLAMMLVVLALLAVAGGALKLYTDRESMADTIDDYGQTLAGLRLPSDQATQAFKAAADSARAGQLGKARAQLKQGREAAQRAPGDRSDAMPGMPGMMPPGADRMPPAQDVESALNSLPEEARPFFEKRPELFRQAFMVSLRAQQQMPKEWEEVHRPAIIEAAAAGDEKRVNELLAKAREKLGPPRGGAPDVRPRGMGPGRGIAPGGGSPDQLKQGIAQGREMLSRARGMGANTKKASDLLDRAERQLARGDSAKAAERMREAFGEMRKMAGRAQGRPPGRGGRRPRMGMRPRGPRGARQGGGPGGIMPGIMGALLGQMQMESGVLADVMGDIENASVALLEKNQDQIREILGAARRKLSGIGERRGELDKRLREAQQPAEGPGRPGQGPGRRPGQRPRGPRGGGFRPGVGARPPIDPQRLHDLLDRALDEAREIPDEEYDKKREDFIRRLIARLMRPSDEAAVTIPPGGPGQMMGPGRLPPIELPAEEPTDREERDKLEAAIRNRLRMIQGPYVKLAQADVEVTQVETLAGQAREAVNEGRLIDAAKFANDATDALWQLLEVYGPELEASAKNEEAEPEEDAASPDEPTDEPEEADDKEGTP